MTTDSDVLPVLAAAPSRKPASRVGARLLASKVPEVTVWFWIITILCTNVGESFADWINSHPGGKPWADCPALLGRARGGPGGASASEPLRALRLLADRRGGQRHRHALHRCPANSRGVPLGLSTTVFAVLLAVVFGVWYARERTLSIHSIVTLPREAFYWFAVLVTFALGTAAGDWNLELAGWGPGTSVLLRRR